VALQGDLSSFALADVLRLLAGTTKTGALEVSSPSGAGEVWLRDGSVVGGAVPAAPHATRAADVVLEILRFDGGSFSFDDHIEVTEDGGTSVEETLAEAEALLEEWHDVEQVVPSMDAWIALAPELEGDDVTVSAEDWRTLAVIGGGLSVRGLAGAEEMTDLVACRRVKALVEQGVIAVRSEVAVVDPEPTDAAAKPIAGEWALPEQPSSVDEPVEELAVEDDRDEATEADLAMLRSDDRPVLLGAADADLLPEPLPGEGASFEALETDDFETAHLVTERAPAMAGAGDDGSAEDDERGSLLRFLSTTKP
jgi:hypothetical protein